LQIAFIAIQDEADVHLRVNVGNIEGLPSVPRDISICAHAIMPEAPDVFVVKDTLQDARYALSAVRC
jgi:hypothetical protein